MSLLHPGTTDTALSRPFQSFVAPDKLFTPKRAARQLVEVLVQQTPEQSGAFLAWDGQSRLVSVLLQLVKADNRQGCVFRGLQAHQRCDAIVVGLLPARCTDCLLYTSPSPRDLSTSRMPSSA